MCEFCTGGVHVESATSARGNDSQLNARLALSQEANMGDMFVSDSTTMPSTDKPDPLTKFGVKVRTNGNEQEFYYTADRSDHVVLRVPISGVGGTDLSSGVGGADGTDPIDLANDQVSADLDKIVKGRITDIEKTYDVKFATPGETVERQWVQDSTTCQFDRGEMLHALQPTLPGLFGIEQALKRSSPSQFALDGKTGAKIYLLDKPYMPDIYGGKQVLGVYKQEDKDKRPALYMTPAGMALPPTAKDAELTGEKRTIAWVTAHEATHNSQRNIWSGFPPEELTKQLGWETIKLDHEGKTIFQWYQLKGKNGELFMHGADNCHTPSTWYLSDKDGNRLDAKGNQVEKISEAAHFTNEEVIDRALVKPITYYFMNPTEMMSEGLTAYRSGTESRTRLSIESPELYKAAQEYDQKELAKFFGTDTQGLPTHVRTPDGIVVPRQ